MSDDARIRVLVADDHEIVREGLIAIIARQKDFLVVAEAVNGQQAVDEFRRHRPDIVVLDINMPVMDGVRATQVIRTEFPDAKIIVLSAMAGDEDIFQALQAGARTYLLKDTLAKTLTDTMRAVLAGGRPLAPEVAERLAQRSFMTDLTPRELDVLRLMSRGRSNREIGDELSLTEGTVKGYVSTILDKLHAADRTQAVLLGLQRGLIHLDLRSGD